MNSSYQSRSDHNIPPSNGEPSFTDTAHDMLLAEPHQQQVAGSSSPPFERVIALDNNFNTTNHNMMMGMGMGNGNSHNGQFMNGIGHVQGNGIGAPGAGGMHHLGNGMMDHGSLDKMNKQANPASAPPPAFSLQQQLHLLQQQQHHQQQHQHASNGLAAFNMQQVEMMNNTTNYLMKLQQQQQQHQQHQAVPPAAAMNTMNTMGNTTAGQAASMSTTTTTGTTTNNLTKTTLGSTTSPLAGLLPPMGSTIGTNMFHGKGAFPLNLTLMLETADSMNLGHVVSWMPSGQCFVIHDPDKFLVDVLPKFFKSSKNTKIRSFYRKLNRWGFTIQRNHHLTKQGVGTTRGVWNHPDFNRTRAVECLKLALETGDTSNFLSVATTGKEGGGNKEGGGGFCGGDEDDGPPIPYGIGEDIYDGTTAPEDVASSSQTVMGANKKKRRASSTSPSLRASTVSSSTENNRASHRQSDFSVGDDTSVGANQEDLFQQALAGNPALGSVAANGNAYGSNNLLSNSFTAGSNNSAIHRQSMPAMGMDIISGNNNFMNKRGRRTSDITSNGLSSSLNNGQSSSLNFSQLYQPISQQARGVIGNGSSNLPSIRSGRQTGVSASWTAGSTLSQQMNYDFNFPNPVIQECDEPLEANTNINNGSFNELANELASFGGDAVPNMPRQGEGQHQGGGNANPDELTQEDLDLANFFERFSETMHK